MSRRTPFLGLGNKCCASAVGEDPGSEVKAERRSATPLPPAAPWGPRPYLEIKEPAVSAIKWPLWSRWLRDPDDVDLQSRSGTAVSTEQPLHRQEL